MKRVILSTAALLAVIAGANAGPISLSDQALDAVVAACNNGNGGSNY
jgi:hypothetical protein